jgi:hypothetical protein
LRTLVVSLAHSVPERENFSREDPAGSELRKAARSCSAKSELTYVRVVRNADAMRRDQSIPKN